jgi:hypothetical protein
LGFVQVTTWQATLGHSLVANHIRELKNFNFWTYWEIVKLKDSQLEIREVKKNSISGKEMRMGVPVTT